MAPYAALSDECHAITRPSPDDLRALAGTPGGRRLAIFAYPWDSLAPLAALPELEVLKLQGAGDLQRLDGAAALRGLRVLVIAPPSSWEGSKRCIEVESYRPLASLARLERLTLLRVRPRDLDLTPIAGLRHLRELHLAGVPEFALADYARLAAALPQTAGRCLQPYAQIDGVGACRRCDARMVLLTGAPPRARQWLCPTCQARKLAEHVRQWDACRAAAARRPPA